MEQEKTCDSAMQRFFEFMIQEHDVILTHTQILEIIDEARILQKTLDE